MSNAEPVLWKSGRPKRMETAPHKKGPPGIAGGSSYAPVRLSYQLRPNRRSYDLTFTFLLLAARKRALWVWQAQLFAKFIRLQLMLNVILNLGLILAYCIDVIPTTPKFSIAVFELQIPKLFIDHETTLTLQIAHKTRHTHFGGISSSMWMWSGQHSASTIFTSFHSHNLRRISPMARFFSP